MTPVTDMTTVTIHSRAVTALKETPEPGSSLPGLSPQPKEATYPGPRTTVATVALATIAVATVALATVAVATIAVATVAMATVAMTIATAATMATIATTTAASLWAEEQSNC